MKRQKEILTAVLKDVGKATAICSFIGACRLFTTVGVIAGLEWIAHPWEIDKVRKK